MAEGPGRTITDSLRHRALLILAVLVLFVGAAGVAVYTLPRTYDAEADLYVDPNATANAVQAADGLLAPYYLEQVTSRRVLERAATELGDPSLTASVLATRVHADTAKATTVIGVHAQAPTARQAADIANAVAHAMIAQNQADIAIRLQQSQAYLSAEVSRLDAAVKAAQAANARPEDIASLRAQHDLAYQRLLDTALQQARAADAVSLLQEAQLPTKPVSPDAKVILPAAAVSGLIIGVLLALLLERLDDRLRNGEELAAATGSPLVVRISPRAGRDANEAERLFGMATAHVLARAPGARTLLTTGASVRDLAPPAATEMASAASHTGRRVLLVHAETDPSDVPQPIQQNGATMTSVAAPGPLELSSSLRDGGGYDLTVVSAPSPLRSPAALSFANNVDAALLVATARSTRFSEVRQAAEALRQAGIEVAGALLLPHSWRRAHGNRKA